MDKNNLKALQDYQQRHPQGESAARAAHEIDRLEQKATAERKTAEHQKADRDAVLQALARFTAAIANKDLATMTAAYPAVPKDSWRQAFSRARSISMTLRPLADPVVNGSSATVDCEQTTHTSSSGQQVTSPARRVRVSLARKEAVWIILHIE